MTPSLGLVMRPHPERVPARPFRSAVSHGRNPFGFDSCSIAETWAAAHRAAALAASWRSTVQAVETARRFGGALWLNCTDFTFHASTRQRCA